MKILILIGIIWIIWEMLLFVNYGWYFLDEEKLNKYLKKVNLKTATFSTGERKKYLKIDEGYFGLLISRNQLSLFSKYFIIDSDDGVDGNSYRIPNKYNKRLNNLGI